MNTQAAPGPHQQQRRVSGGAPPQRASHAVILVHGRGGGRDDMLQLAQSLALPDVAWLAPEAAGHSWWPSSFLAPLTQNEPQTMCPSTSVVMNGIRMFRFIGSNRAVSPRNSCRIGLAGHHVSGAGVTLSGVLSMR